MILATYLPDPEGWAHRLLSLVGLFAMAGLAWLWARATGRHRDIRWRPVVWGMALQLIFGLVVLNPVIQGTVFSAVDAGVGRLLAFAGAGATFVFQSVEPHQILDMSGQAHTYAGQISPPMKTFAFWILPTIIFFSALMTAGYHLGIMQRIVYGMAWVMQRTLGTSGAETLAAAGNIFLGQTEAPLLIRPYLERMTRSELNAVMVGGFANVAGGVLAAYVAFLQGIPGIAGHLVTASILSAPASLAIAKLMVPEDPQVRPDTTGVLILDVERLDRNLLAAVARGASEGVQLAITVAAVLIAFVAMIAMVDWGLGLIPFLGEPLSMARMLSWLFAPLAWLMGIPWAECGVVGRLLGEKLVLTEFIAYVHLGEVVASATPQLSERSATITSYALCGFANFASIGIQIGGIGSLIPKRTGDLAELGLCAMIGGSLATFQCATIAGLFY